MATVAAASAVVKETGFADSEAIRESAIGAEPTVVNYYFPVEIVIVGGLCEGTHQAIQARIWEKLSDALERLG
jgi:hypothetical protein